MDEFHVDFNIDESDDAYNKSAMYLLLYRLNTISDELFTFYKAHHRDSPLNPTTYHINKSLHQPSRRTNHQYSNIHDYTDKSQFLDQLFQIFHNHIHNAIFQAQFLSLLTAFLTHIIHQHTPVINNHVFVNSLHPDETSIYSLLTTILASSSSTQSQQNDKTVHLIIHILYFIKLFILLYDNGCDYTFAVMNYRPYDRSVWFSAFESLCNPDTYNNSSFHDNHLDHSNHNYNNNSSHKLDSQMHESPLSITHSLYNYHHTPFYCAINMDSSLNLSKFIVPHISPLHTIHLAPSAAQTPILNNTYGTNNLFNEDVYATFSEMILFYLRQLNCFHSTPFFFNNTSLDFIGILSDYMIAHGLRENIINNIKKPSLSRTFSILHDIPLDKNQPSTPSLSNLHHNLPTLPIISTTFPNQNLSPSNFSHLFNAYIISDNSSVYQELAQIDHIYDLSGNTDEFINDSSNANNTSLFNLPQCHVGDIQVKKGAPLPTAQYLYPIRLPASPLQQQIIEECIRKTNLLPQAPFKKNEDEYHYSTGNTASSHDNSPCWLCYITPLQQTTSKHSHSFPLLIQPHINLHISYICALIEELVILLTAIPMTTISHLFTNVSIINNQDDLPLDRRLDETLQQPLHSRYIQFINKLCEVPSISLSLRRSIMRFTYKMSIKLKKWLNFRRPLPIKDKIGLANHVIENAYITGAGVELDGIRNVFVCTSANQYLSSTLLSMNQQADEGDFLYILWYFLYVVALPQQIALYNTTLNNILYHYIDSCRLPTLTHQNISHSYFTLPQPDSRALFVYFYTFFTIHFPQITLFPIKLMHEYCTDYEIIINASPDDSQSCDVELNDGYDGELNDFVFPHNYNSDTTNHNILQQATTSTVGGFMSLADDHTVLLPKGNNISGADWDNVPITPLSRTLLNSNILGPSDQIDSNMTHDYDKNLTSITKHTEMDENCGYNTDNLTNITNTDIFNENIFTTPVINTTITTSIYKRPLKDANNSAFMQFNQTVLGYMLSLVFPIVSLYIYILRQHNSYYTASYTTRGEKPSYFTAILSQLSNSLENHNITQTLHHYFPPNPVLSLSCGNLPLPLVPPCSDPIHPNEQLYHRRHYLTPLPLLPHTIDPRPNDISHIYANIVSFFSEVLYVLNKYPKSPHLLLKKTIINNLAVISSFVSPYMYQSYYYYGLFMFPSVEFILYSAMDEQSSNGKLKYLQKQKGLNSSSNDQISLNYGHPRGIAIGNPKSTYNNNIIPGVTKNDETTIAPFIENISDNTLELVNVTILTALEQAILNHTTMLSKYNSQYHSLLNVDGDQGTSASHIYKQYRLAKHTGMLLLQLTISYGNFIYGFNLKNILYMILNTNILYYYQHIIVSQHKFLQHYNAIAYPMTNASPRFAPELASLVLNQTVLLHFIACTIAGLTSNIRLFIHCPRNLLHNNNNDNMLHEASSCKSLSSLIQNKTINTAYYTTSPTLSIIIYLALYHNWSSIIGVMSSIAMPDLFVITATVQSESLSQLYNHYDDTLNHTHSGHNSENNMMQLEGSDIDPDYDDDDNNDDESNELSENSITIPGTNNKTKEKPMKFLFFIYDHTDVCSYNYLQLLHTYICLPNVNPTPTTPYNYNNDDSFEASFTSPLTPLSSPAIDITSPGYDIEDTSGRLRHTTVRSPPLLAPLYLQSHLFPSVVEDNYADRPFKGSYRPHNTRRNAIDNTSFIPNNPIVEKYSKTHDSRVYKSLYLLYFEAISRILQGYCSISDITLFRLQLLFVNPHIIESKIPALDEGHTLSESDSDDEEESDGDDIDNDPNLDIEDFEGENFLGVNSKYLPGIFLSSLNNDASSVTHTDLIRELNEDYHNYMTCQKMKQRYRSFLGNFHENSGDLLNINQEPYETHHIDKDYVRFYKENAQYYNVENNPDDNQKTFFKTVPYKIPKATIRNDNFIKQKYYIKTLYSYETEQNEFFRLFDHRQSIISLITLFPDLSMLYNRPLLPKECYLQADWARIEEDLDYEYSGTTFMRDEVTDRIDAFADEIEHRYIEYTKAPQSLGPAQQPSGIYNHMLTTSQKFSKLPENDMTYWHRHYLQLKHYNENNYLNAIICDTYQRELFLKAEEEHLQKNCKGIMPMSLDYASFMTQYTIELVIDCLLNENGWMVMEDIDFSVEKAKKPKNENLLNHEKNLVMCENFDDFRDVRNKMNNNYTCTTTPNTQETISRNDHAMNAYFYTSDELIDNNQRNIPITSDFLQTQLFFSEQSSKNRTHIDKPKLDRNQPLFHLNSHNICHESQLMPTRQYNFEDDDHPNFDGGDHVHDNDYTAHNPQKIILPQQFDHNDRNNEEAQKLPAQKRSNIDPAYNKISVTHPYHHHVDFLKYNVTTQELITLYNSYHWTNHFVFDGQHIPNIRHSSDTPLTPSYNSIQQALLKKTPQQPLSSTNIKPIPTMMTQLQYYENSSGDENEPNSSDSLTHNPIQSQSTQRDPDQHHIDPTYHSFKEQLVSSGSPSISTASHTTSHISHTTLSTINKIISPPSRSSSNNKRRLIPLTISNNHNVHTNGNSLTSFSSNSSHNFSHATHHKTTCLQDTDNTNSSSNASTSCYSSFDSINIHIPRAQISMTRKSSNNINSSHRSDKDDSDGSSTSYQSIISTTQISFKKQSNIDFISFITSPYHNNEVSDHNDNSKESFSYKKRRDNNEFSLNSPRYKEFSSNYDHPQLSSNTVIYPKINITYTYTSYLSFNNNEIPLKPQIPTYNPSKHLTWIFSFSSQYSPHPQIPQCSSNLIGFTNTNGNQSLSRQNKKSILAETNLSNNNSSGYIDIDIIYDTTDCSPTEQESLLVFNINSIDHNNLHCHNNNIKILDQSLNEQKTTTSTTSSSSFSNIIPRQVNIHPKKNPSLFDRQLPINLYTSSIHLCKLFEEIATLPSLTTPAHSEQNPSSVDFYTHKKLFPAHFASPSIHPRSFLSVYFALMRQRLKLAAADTTVGSSTTHSKQLKGSDANHNNPNSKGANATNNHPKTNNGTQSNGLVNNTPRKKKKNTKY